MSFNVIPTPLFERELKKLSKRHISIKTDVAKLIATLEKTPAIGESLGNNCYKIRMAVSSKNKVKSGRARIITYLKVVKEEIYLLSIYDKTDTDTLGDNEIISRLKLL